MKPQNFICQLTPKYFNKIHKKQKKLESKINTKRSIQLKTRSTNAKYARRFDINISPKNIDDKLNDSLISNIESIEESDNYNTKIKTKNI